VIDQEESRAASDHSPTRRYDVVVISGSSAGVAAAIAAGRLGARVALVEDTPVLGGFLANGVSNLDAYSLQSISGIADEFRRAVIDWYRDSVDSDPVFSKPPDDSQHFDGRSRQTYEPLEGGRWEPHAADAIFRRLVAEIPAIDVYYDRYPVEVVKHGSRVVGVVTEASVGPDAYSPPSPGGRIDFRAEVVIDATHEGDIAAWAGVPYRVGREARSRLEPHAGDIRFFDGTGEIMSGGGTQDRAVVSYGVRLTCQLHSEPDGSRLLAEPPGYDPARYEMAPDPAIFTVPFLPGGKVELNANPIGNELQEINWAWPEAGRAQRARLYERYRDHALGFLYHLQHAKGLKLCLPADEFVHNGGVPYRLFVREARRIVGEDTMTEADVNPFVLSNGLLPPHRADSVAIGHYPIDAKPVRTKSDFSTPDKGEGDFFLVDASTAFQVPYGALVPQAVDGLLVPAALSATHVAFSAVRMDPTWMALGQAAGVAAALSVKSNVEVRRLRTEHLQRELLRQAATLVFYWDLPADHPSFVAVQWLSLRGVVGGYPDRTFRPDQILSRAELAAALFHGFDLWPSVSEIHFTDLPHDHPAFRHLETLFDNRALEPFGVSPLWPGIGPYEPGAHAWFGGTRYGLFGQIKPDEPVTWDQALAVVERLITSARGSANPPTPVPELAKVVDRSEFGRAYSTRRLALDGPVRRGDFCAFLASLLDSRSRAL
jgi:hypothetical protein